MEVRFLEKYKNLIFFDPYTECYLTVEPDNLEFWRGKEGGWHVIGESNDDDVEDEGFGIVLVNEMIGETQ